MYKLLKGTPIEATVQFVSDDVFPLTTLVLIVCGEELKQVRACTCQHCTVCMELHIANLNTTNYVTLHTRLPKLNCSPAPHKLQQVKKS